MLVCGISLSYGVRHMHSSISYCLSYLVARELMIYRAIYVMLFLLSCLVLAFVARYALSIKYRGSVDPSMCAVQSKALL